MATITPVGVPTDFLKHESTELGTGDNVVDLSPILRNKSVGLLGLVVFNRVGLSGDIEVDVPSGVAEERQGGLEVTTISATIPDQDAFVMRFNLGDISQFIRDNPSFIIHNVDDIGGLFAWVHFQKTPN